MTLRLINDAPLVYDALLGVVQFKMRDGARVVHCMVSDVALSSRATRDGRPERDVERLFALYRAEVERLASTQYDDGIQNPVVRSHDLAPPPPIPSGISAAKL